MPNLSCAQVPPLEGFVMNRVIGDYFENLLYKLFVSVDERTNVEQLAHVLQMDVDMIKALLFFSLLGTQCSRFWGGRSEQTISHVINP